MSLTITDRAVQAYYLLAPPPAGGTALPGAAETKVSILFGWALGAIGIIAVLALMGAGVMFMYNKHQGQSNEGPVLVGKILAGVILADIAIATVTAIQ